MHIKHTVLGKGDKKILFDIEMGLYYKQEFDELVQSGEYTFYFLERKQFTSLFSHDFLNRVPFSDLDKTYKKNSDLKDKGLCFYEYRTVLVSRFPKFIKKGMNNYCFVHRR